MIEQGMLGLETRLTAKHWDLPCLSYGDAEDSELPKSPRKSVTEAALTLGSFS